MVAPLESGKVEEVEKWKSKWKSGKVEEVEK
jgi:hypothetical protein